MPLQSSALEATEAAIEPREIPSEEASVDEVLEETLFACGKDHWARPTLVARPCMHKASSPEESLLAVKNCMETVRDTFDQLPKGEDQILVLYDLGGAGYSNFDMTFTRELIQGLVTEFPDRLQKVLVINGHWSITAAWSTIQRFLHPETRQKVVFCGSDYRSELQDYISDDHPYLEYLQV